MDWININDDKPSHGVRIWVKDQQGNAVAGTCNISPSGACSLITDTPGVSILNVQFWVSRLEYDMYNFNPAYPGTKIITIEYEK